MTGPSAALADPWGALGLKQPLHSGSDQSLDGGHPGKGDLGEAAVSGPGDLCRRRRGEGRLLAVPSQLSQQVLA